MLVRATLRSSGCNLSKGWPDDGRQHESYKQSFHLASPDPGAGVPNAVGGGVAPMLVTEHEPDLQRTYVCYNQLD